MILWSAARLCTVQCTQTKNYWNGRKFSPKNTNQIRGHALQYEAKLDNLIYISKWLWKDVVIITNAKMSVISCSFLTEKAHEIGY